MKILSNQQTRWLDQYTIDHVPIASINLMENACRALLGWIKKHCNSDNSFQFFVGPGNNGGDGLGLARLLHQETSAKIEVVTCFFDKQLSPDCKINLDQVMALKGISVVPFGQQSTDFDHTIDALFGSGLKGAIRSPFDKVIKHINSGTNVVIAIDLPSGILADEYSSGISVKANYTLTFQTPKLCMMMPSLANKIGEWEFLNIGLLAEGIDKIQSDKSYITSDFAASLYKRKGKFDHKGSNGRACIIAGSDSMPGAALLAAESCLRSGAGLVTLHSTNEVCNAAVVKIPEIILSRDPEEVVSTKPVGAFDAIGIGPGIGGADQSSAVIKELLVSRQCPIVLDADALNIISRDPDMLKFISLESILTPHPKEFQRLFGSSANDFARLELLRHQSKLLKIIIVLKGAHTVVATPSGMLYFNSTGNQGMATAGSGDVLTGILTALLAQGYSSEDAAVLGVYLHGLAGDFALKQIGSYEGLLAGDIIKALPHAFKSLYPS